MAAVRNLGRLVGSSLSALDSPRLALLKRSYKKNCTHRPLRPKRIPITIWVLTACLPHLAASDATFFALCCVGVFGLFRGGELTYKNAKSGLLLRSDVTWFPDVVIIRLRNSKTDVDGLGVNVKTQGCSSAESCFLRDRSNASLRNFDVETCPWQIVVS